MRLKKKHEFGESVFIILCEVKNHEFCESVFIICGVEKGMHMYMNMEDWQLKKSGDGSLTTVHKQKQVRWPFCTSDCLSNLECGSALHAL